MSEGPALPPEITVLLGDPQLPDAVKRGGRFNEEDLDSLRRLRAALEENSPSRFHYLDDHAMLAVQLASDPPAFVLNFCDEGFDNHADFELHIPALLEMYGIPYSGAAPACLALCRNKSWVRAIAADLGIPIPHENYLPANVKVSADQAYPLLIKPNLGDGSIGITQDAIVNNAHELNTSIARTRTVAPVCAVLLQEFLAGPEYSIALIGNPAHGLEALPILEVDYSSLPDALPHMLTWESKWEPDSPYWNQIGYRRARLGGAEERILEKHSRLLFERLECRDYARFDFRTGADGQIKLLEVNPNPGWCWDGKLNLMAGFAGIGYPQLLQAILGAAWLRVSGESSPFCLAEYVHRSSSFSISH